jgi:hypothetical protein
MIEVESSLSSSPLTPTFDHFDIEPASSPFNCSTSAGEDDPEDDERIISQDETLQNATASRMVDDERDEATTEDRQGLVMGDVQNEEDLDDQDIIAITRRRWSIAHDLLMEEQMPEQIIIPPLEELPESLILERAREFNRVNGHDADSMLGLYILLHHA